MCFHCSDDETFLSADDLRINIWNLNVNEQSFNIVDLKPANMEELTEVRSVGPVGTVVVSNARIAGASAALVMAAL